jgi:N-acyl-D-amino-acid deacylase
MLRKWLSVLAFLWLWGSPAGSSEPTGCAAHGLEPFDVAMMRLIHEWELPGGGLAVAHNGRPLLVRGYGVADKASGTPVSPHTMFRLGSLSKPITAVAILKLVEEGHLGLDDKVIPLLGDLAPPTEAIRDPRVHAITVRHLLQHTAGFDRDVSGDPMFMPRAGDALARENAKLPPTCRLILHAMLQDQLDFDPGSRFAYSNLGYCILGRIVERITGVSYVEYVRRQVLEPAAASGLMLGRTLAAAPGEAVYYDYPGAPTVKGMPGVGDDMVARPYGYAAIEEMDAYGAWIGTPVDYLRFVLAIDGQHGPRLLNDASVREMLSRPQIPGTRRPTFYGLGVFVRVLPDGSRNWWHTGVQPGFHAFALHTARGYAWVSAFNSVPHDRESFWKALDTSLWSAARLVGQWPTSSEACSQFD